MIRAAVFASLLGIAACHPAPPRSAPLPGSATDAARVVVLVSATVEWKMITAQFPGDVQQPTPFGTWFRHRIGGEDVVLFHGGYGKVSAAGSTQYAIDRWHPSLLVNIGTSGGFGGERKVGDIVLATDTLIYDLFERMGSAEETIEDYHTQLTQVAWPAKLANRVIKARMISGDGDLDPAAVGALHAKYHTGVGDWESGAIAWVATHNRTPVMILRGITDLVDAAGDPTYNAVQVWERETAAMMTSLVNLLGEALPELVR